MPYRKPYFHGVYILRRVALQTHTGTLCNVTGGIGAVEKNKKRRRKAVFEWCHLKWGWWERTSLRRGPLGLMEMILLT